MVHYREATAADAPCIAALHARSWQEHYRADLSTDYLLHEAPAERLRTWTERFATPSTAMWVQLAEEQAELVGFCCVFFDHDPQAGSLLGDLHVSSGQQGRGIGKQLLHLAARRVLAYDSQGKLYLWVLSSNTAAAAVYRHLGGHFGEETYFPLPGAGPRGARSIRVDFTPSDLAARTKGAGPQVEA